MKNIYRDEVTKDLNTEYKPVEFVTDVRFLNDHVDTIFSLTNLV
jgi:hypothetical protein